MQNIWQHIYAAFIEADRWKLYLKGLGVTLEVSFFAALLGILIGTIAAFLKLSTRKNGSKTIASRIASAYIDIIRGTPTTVQLLIMWSGILATCKNSVLIASLTFGINSGAYVSKAYLTDTLKIDNFAMQQLTGDHNIYAGFAGIGNSLLTIANPFADEEFETVDLDALDAVGEFTNCINGLFASELGNEGVDMDMLPPAFYEKASRITGNQFCVFPIHVEEQEIFFILAIDSIISVN